VANLPVKDGNGSLAYLQSTGTGTSLDPYIPRQAITMAAGAQADGHSLTLGAQGDVQALVGDGSLVALLKALRTLLAGGLPAALGGAGGAKVEVVSALPTGNNALGWVAVSSLPADPLGANADALVAAGAAGSVSAKLRRLSADLAALLALFPAALGRTTMAGSLSVAVASDQPAFPVTDAAGSLTVDSPQLPAALGQGTMAASLPVVLASDQSALTVTANAGSGTFAISAAALPLPAGAATNATLTALTITQGTALGTNTGPLIQGSVTTAAPAYTTGQIRPLSLSTTGSLRVDGSGATQPISGTVTANAGTGTFTVGGTVAATQSGTWNVGTLTSITNVVHVDDNAGSLTIDSTQLPASLGQKAMTASLAVVVASDQSNLPIAMPAGGPPVDGTLAATTTAAILGTQACKRLLVQADPNNTDDVFLGDATNQRFRLTPGYAVALDVTNANTVKGKSASGTQNINWIALN
jgi:hypothetical protein